MRKPKKPAPTGYRLIAYDPELDQVRRAWASVPKRVKAQYARRSGLCSSTITKYLNGGTRYPARIRMYYLMVAMNYEQPDAKWRKKEDGK